MYEQSIETLISEGFKRETLPIIIEHSKLLKRFGLDCHIVESKHEYMLQVSYNFKNEKKKQHNLLLIFLFSATKL